MTSPRVLTQRELNRALLARQMLLDRAPVTVPQALERMGGLQAQYAPSMYIGLWSRVEGFGREQLTAALEDRSAVQGTLLRATIHLVSRRDYWPFALAGRASRRRMWLRATHGEPSEKDIEEAAGRLRAQLAEGPLPRREVEAMLGRTLANGVGLWVDLVRAPPSGTWEHRRADLYASAEGWLGPPGTPEGAGAAEAGAGPGGRTDLQAAAVDMAVEHVVARYLGGFGPASTPEVANWAGLHPSEVEPVLQRMSLRTFWSEDGTELFDLPGAPLPPAAAPAPVRLLPTWDAILLVHARRKLVVAEEHRPLLFNTRTPHSKPTFLVDGRVAGTWRYDNGRVDVDPFEPLAPAALDEVREEAARMAAFHA